MINLKYVPAFNVTPGLEVVPWSTGEGCTFFYEDKCFDLDRQEFDTLIEMFIRVNTEGTTHFRGQSLTILDDSTFFYAVHKDDHAIPFNHLPVLIGLGFLAFSGHFTEKK